MAKLSKSQRDDRAQDRRDARQRAEARAAAAKIAATHAAAKTPPTCTHGAGPGGTSLWTCPTCYG